jgi:hypothetical protein
MHLSPEARRYLGKETNFNLSFISIFSLLFWVRLQNFEKRLLASSYASVRMEQIGSHCTDVRNIWYLLIFRKPVENFQVSLKSYKINWYLIRRLRIIMTAIRLIFLKMKNIQTRVVDKIKTHRSWPATFFQKPCCLWDSVKDGRAGEAKGGDKMRCMRFECRISKVINTLRIYLILIYSPRRK